MAASNIQREGKKNLILLLCMDWNCSKQVERHRFASFVYN